MRENPEMSLEQAFEVAADDITLDRFAIVAPIVLVDLIPNNGEASFTNSIVNGTSIGYFPLADNPQIAINRMVVDLSYRSTVDILTLSERLASLSDTERLRLRYALAKMDTLRVPKIDANFTEAIGQKITDIRVGNKATNTVHFILDNGKTLEVLLPAAPVDLSGPVRKKPRTAHA